MFRDLTDEQLEAARALTDVRITQQNCVEIAAKLLILTMTSEIVDEIDRRKPKKD